MMKTLCLVVALWPAVTLAVEPPPLNVDIGPVKGHPGKRRVVTFDGPPHKTVLAYDMQDDLEHRVRGLTLREVLLKVGVPKGADTIVFKYKDGMEIPVRLDDKTEVDAIFIAFQHGNVLEKFSSSYPVEKRFEGTCPKLIYRRLPTEKYSIWLHPTDLDSMQLVTWKIHEAKLAQPTRRLPDRSGWPIYLRHCQSCHGIGTQGARRGPDFLSNMDAYRRVPPLEVTDRRKHPSLHEKVKGLTSGTMPVLDHVSDEDIATLWRWLHAIHRGATK